MTSEILKSGIEWLAEFSRARRRARANQTRYIRTEGSYEFGGKKERQPTWTQTCRPGWMKTGVIEQYQGTTGKVIVTHNDKIDWLLELQGYRCYLCMRAFSNKRKTKDYPNKDHVMPRSLGGKDSRNILISHIRCNKEKNTRLPTACEILYRDFIHIDIGPPSRLNKVQELEFIPLQEHTGVKQMLDVIS